MSNENKQKKSLFPRSNPSIQKLRCCILKLPWKQINSPSEHKIIKNPQPKQITYDLPRGPLDINVFTFFFYLQNIQSLNPRLHISFLNKLTLYIISVYVWKNSQLRYTKVAML